MFFFILLGFGPKNKYKGIYQYSYDVGGSGPTTLFWTVILRGEGVWKARAEDPKKILADPALK